MGKQWKQFSSVTLSCPTLFDPMNRSTPGLPVRHQLQESTQTHVRQGSDAIQPSHPLSSPSPPALNLSQHQGLFKWVSSWHQVAKVLEFQLQHQSFQWTPRTDLLQNALVGSPCSPRDSQESSPTPQFKSINSSVLSFFIVHLSHPYMTTGKTVADFILGGSKITAGSDCSHEIKRHLLLGKKVMTNLDRILKSRDLTLPTKICLVKAMVFLLVMYECESWTIKKAEPRKIDAFELWCWRRLLRVYWTAKRSNQSILKEISPEYSLEGPMLKLKL